MEKNPQLPFESLHSPLDLTDSGRPVFLENESEIVTKTCVSLFDHSHSSELKCTCHNATAILTTHRMIFLSSDSNVSLAFWNMSRIEANPGGHWRSSSKILIWSVYERNRPAAVVQCKSDRDEVLRFMQSSFNKQAWITLSASEVISKIVNETPDDFDSRAGVAGILRRQEMHREVTSKIANEAFSDLNSLMIKAKDVVAVIERYQAFKCSQQAVEEGNNNDADFENVILDFGFVSPVTKVSAGSMYHQQLAKQLADFLGYKSSKGIIRRFGGMMTLPDIYAAFNRARGTELISPQDLRTVCEMLESLNLGLKLKEFSSGVAVVQVSDFDEKGVSLQLLEASKKSPITFASVAFTMKISLVLAQEHILNAENDGLLCRDETLEDLQFYPNEFMTF